METDFFTRALKLAHSFDSNVTSQERLNAEKYLMELEDSPEGLHIAFHIINNEPVQEVRCFWAFNTVIHQLPSLAQSVNAAQADELYSTLFMFIYRFFFTPAAAPADFLVNKHAQVMAVGLQNFYPARWSDFFKDLFDLLARGKSQSQSEDAITMYFLRVCEYIDERVVSTRDRVELGKDQRARDMEIKDAMRGAVVIQLVDAWYRILSEYRHRSLEIAKLCLDVLQTYIEWIDISLLTTADWINMLYYLIALPPLQVAACECLLSLVEKKQLPGTKMQNLRMLNVVDSLPRLVSMLTVPPTSEAEVGFIVIVCRLTAAVAEQFLSLLGSCTAILGEGEAEGEGGEGQKVENYPNSLPRSFEVSPPRVVVGVDGVIVQDIPFEVTPQLLDNLSAALHAVVRQLLRLFQIHLFEARDVILPFVQAFVKSSEMTDAEVEQLLCALFDGSISKPIVYQEGDLWDQALVGQRQIMHNLTRLLYRRSASSVIHHLGGLVQGVVDGQHGASLAYKDSFSNNNSNNGSSEMDFTKPEVVEAVLVYFYEIGSAVKPEVCLRDPNDAITYYFSQLLTSDNIVTHHTSASVHLIFFDVVDRYHVFFTYHPQYIPILLQRFLLLPCGVSNSDDRVRGRICYLFLHLIQVLKPCLTAYAVNILHALQSILLSGSSQECHQRRHGLRPGDRRDLWEVVGVLLPIAVMFNDNSNASNNDNQQNGIDNSIETVEEKLQGANFHLAQLLVGEALENLQAVATVEEGVGGEEGEGENRGDSMGKSPLAARTSPRHTANSTSNAAHGMAMASAHTVNLIRGEHSAACVADAVSYLTAIAKGLGGGGPALSPTPGSPANRPGSRESVGVSERLAGEVEGGAALLPPLARAVAALFARLFPPVVARVQRLYAASPWRASGVVREAVAQFLQQMINLLPWEHLIGFCENYAECSLSAMETVQELSKLLRLLDQFVNKIGARGIASIARMLPMVWDKVMSAGELSTASPVVNMGVISESARETFDVYRNFFHLLFSIGTWGCAPAVLLLPPPYLDSMLAQLSYAILLPAEVGLPKFSLQSLTRLSQDLLASPVVEGLPSDSGASATFTENRLYFKACLLERVLPSTLQAILSPSFNINDAKNFVLIGEAGHFFKALCSVQEPGKGGHVSKQFDGEATVLADAALQAIYKGLKAPCQGSNTQNGFSSADPNAEDPIMSFCLTLREKPRFNVALKNQLRTLIAAAQQTTC